jgi:SAM-dependent methyltransferase
LESERIIGLYQQHAAAWDRIRSPGSLFERPWLDRFLKLVPAGGSILDLGCGAGLPISGYLIRQGYAVVGVDSSGPLIELCRGRFPDREWIVADMRTLDLERRFAGVIAWDSFFHLSPEDQQAMFPVFARHAAEGAALMLTSGPRHGCVLAEFEGEPLYHGSLDPEEYRAELDETGFAVVDYVIEDPTCGWHTVWLAQRRRGEPGPKGSAPE